MDTFLKVKELQAKGTPIKRIATDLKMSRNTVKSYFNQESLSPRKSSKSTNIEVFTDLIIALVNISEYTVQPNPEYSIHTDSGVYCTYQ
jgi:orotate phosphoribosyltransferase-like protein